MTRLIETEEQVLQKTLAESCTFDSLLLREVGLRKRRRVRKHLWITLIIVLLLTAAGGWLRDMNWQADGFRLERELADMPLAEINAVIAALEMSARKPGDAGDYARLSAAYGRRFALQASAEDLARQTEFRLKAESLRSKQYKEDSMMRNPVTFGLLWAVILIASIGGISMLYYNRLVRTDEAVDGRWAQVDSVMQRRLDLIPAVVETVKRYAQHEKETLVQVTEARGKALAALQAGSQAAPQADRTIREIEVSQREVDSALGRLIALSERYPDLKASSNFAALQDQLEGTENRISVERQRYNDAVRDYNTVVRQFPAIVFARMFGFDVRSYFESESGAENPVEMGF